MSLNSHWIQKYLPSSLNNWKNVRFTTLQQISVQVLYQIAWREELLSFHLHLHTIILYVDATSKTRFAHYFYAKYLHGFTKMDIKISNFVLRCKNIVCYSFPVSFVKFLHGHTKIVVKISNFVLWCKKIACYSFSGSFQYFCTKIQWFCTVRQNKLWIC